MEHSSDSWAPPVPEKIPSTSSQPQHGESANRTHRQRRIHFWVAAGFAWAVWTLAVIAAAHDEWIVVDQEKGEFEAGNELVLYSCDNTFDSEFDHFCSLYRGFTAAQFVATVTCSIAAALLALAAFRPAVARYGSVESLSIAGGIALIVYVAVQLGAAVLLHLVANELEDLVNEQTAADITVQLGGTFWLAVAGLILGLCTSICLLLEASHAGDGPFYGTGRLWITSGLAWVVWALAVTAAAHEEWLLVHLRDTPTGWIGLGDGDALENCNKLDEVKSGDDGESIDVNHFCDLYRGFTAAQFAATAACSIAVALLTLAVFRPAVAGCASVKSLARAGGVILIVYAIFQLGAAVLAHFLAKEFERVFNFFELEFGPRFWIGVAGLVLAAIASCSLLLNAKNAGDGPLSRRACALHGENAKHGVV